MVLIYPPVAKPCEPPAGIARLSGALALHGKKHTLLDANLEGMLYLLNASSPLPGTANDKWTSRALKNISRNLASLKTPDLYKNIDRYKRTVADIGRALEMSVPSLGIKVGLANYQDERLSPLRSVDLIESAENPEKNPFYPYFQKRLMRLIEEEQPRIVGISLNYLSQALSAFAMAGFLKKEFASLKIVLGGGLVTSWAKRPGWKNPFSGLFGGMFDHIVAGPGEHTLLSLAGVEGCEESSFTPDYGRLPLKDYLSPGLILPYSASGGCYWRRCAFCPEKAEANPYVPVPADIAIADMKKLTDHLSPSLLHLSDNAISPALLQRIIQDPPGVPWYGFARIDRHLADPDFCMALKRSGCVMLKLGLESGDQSVLDRMQKGIDLETASAALKSLEKAGIATYVYLIFGTPYENESEARRTLDFTVRHNSGIGFLNLAIFNMPINGPEAETFATEHFYEGDLSLYTGFNHPEGWDRKKVRLFLENEFKKHKTVAGILKKDPPVFTSNHAPFFIGFK